MQIFHRPQCAITRESSIQEIYTFENFPISMNCVISEQKNDLFANMKWGASSSGAIQLTELLDPKLLYTEYHSPGTVGKTWKEHHHNLFVFINEDSYNDVLEIGGASGLLAENFFSVEKPFSWTIVEPTRPTEIKDKRIHFVNNFFENWNPDKKFDTLVHSHVFEHVYDPIEFLLKTNNILVDGGIQYISIPNMHYWLSHGFSNTLSFEHTFYVDQHVLEYLLNKTGFEVSDWRINDHSIFVKAKKTNKFRDIKHNFDYIKTMFEHYVYKQQQDVAEIKKQLGDRSFYLFGAHIFAQSLFNFGIDQNKVINLLDNDPNKQEKRLYGTRCWVKSPRVLEGQDCPIVLLRAGSYSQEIKESIKKINPRTIFI